MESLIQTPGLFEPVWLDEDRLGEWDRFVESHPYGTAWHLSAWKNHLRTVFRHISGDFLVIREPGGGAIRAGVPVYRATSFILGTRLVSAPFATFCDPLISTNEELLSLLSVLASLVSTGTARSIEIRALKTAQLSWGDEFAVSRRFKHHAVLLDVPIEQVRMRFSRKGVSKVITKAEQAGVLIHRCDKGLSQLVSLLEAERQRMGLFPMPSGFFESISNNLEDRHRSFYVASWNGGAVGVLVVLKCGRTHVLEHSAEAPSARNMGVRQFMCWQAIRDASVAGAGSVSFGRTSLDDEGLLAYKRRWGASEDNLDFRVLSFGGRTAGRLGPPPAPNALLGSFVRWCPRPFLKGLSKLLYGHWA